MSVDFKNASPTDAGYGPYVDVVLPATGTDGNDGIHYTAGSATYLGAAVHTTVLTFDALGHAVHPYAIDPGTGLPLVVNGTPGDQLVVFQLPFGSFTPGQPDAIVNFQADLSNLANLGNPLTVSADSGFEFGNSPTGTTSVLGAAQTTTVTPQLFTITKTYLGPELETATGPDFPQRYEIDVSVAPGQTITNFALNDALPGNIQFTAVDSATANGGVVAGSLLPSLTTPGGLLSETFSQVTGTGGPTDAKLIYTFYVPRDPNGLDGTQTPALTTGGFTPSPNTATGAGNWTPIDPRDPAVVATGTSNTVTLTEKSIAIQKSVADVQGNPTDAVAVGDQLRYSLNFQISDFFAFNQLVATDLFSDGQHFDAGFTPQLTFTRDGATHTLTFGTDAYTLAPQSHRRIGSADVEYLSSLARRRLRRHAPRRLDPQRRHGWAGAERPPLLRPDHGCHHLPDRRAADVRRAAIQHRHALRQGRRRARRQDRHHRPGAELRRPGRHGRHANRRQRRVGAPGRGSARPRPFTRSTASSGPASALRRSPPATPSPTG